jgi:hypothetical protein
MPVVKVRIVRVRMRQRRVVMRMRVWLRTVPGEVMLMLVMRVVAVTVRMVKFLVCMCMPVAFGNVQPHADGHERPRHPEHDGR